MKNLKDKSWYGLAVAACIAVTLYVVLINLGSITGAIGHFLGYFKTVFFALILAYIINPLAKFFDEKIFCGIKKEKLRWTIAVAAAVLIVILALGFLLGTLIPQLADSITTLINNMDGYISSLSAFADKLGLGDTINLDSLVASTDDILSSVQSLLVNNANNILNAGASAGRGVATWCIALILSVYFLSNKAKLKKDVLRLMRAVLPERSLNKLLTFLTRSDRILVQYIVFSLIDCLIVGVANALFMLVCGMQYIGIVSVIVAVTNLIPNFGPIIGGVIGGFILLLVNPLHALIFIIFSFVLQFFDGYILKPKLFGNSLGVSGLLILISVIVCGSMFGVIGMLLAIPIAAILDFVYSDVLLPWLEKRAAKRKADKLAEAAADEAASDENATDEDTAKNVRDLGRTEN